jgi:PII-like signaling protein
MLGKIVTLAVSPWAIQFNRMKEMAGAVVFRGLIGCQFQHPTYF